MKVHYTRWILVITFIILVILDIADGNIPKIITTVLLAVSVIAFAFGYTSPKQRTWFAVGFVFSALAIAGFVYRLIVFSRQH